LEALRLICDDVSNCGGVLKVPLTKDLLASVASARSQYRLCLEQERKKRESDAQTQKRKAAEDELQELKQQRRVLDKVCAILENDANQLAEEAEGKAGSKMAQLITKSNTLRRRHKEKKEELVKMDKTIALAIGFFAHKFILGLYSTSANNSSPVHLLDASL